MAVLLDHFEGVISLFDMAYFMKMFVHAF